jgi:hypothetical protein
MSLVKILAILIVAIAVGILVVSNFSLVIPVVWFGQKTVAVAMGLWLLLAIAVGFGLGSLLQVVAYFQRRSLVKRLRQLQQRNHNEEDVFTYTPPRSRVKQSTNPVVEEEDDWETDRVSSPTMDWEDREPPPRRPSAPAVSTYEQPDRRDRLGVRDDEIDPGEVYDADFKLIQPPYKQPPELEFDEPEITEDELDVAPEDDFSSPDQPIESPRQESYPRDPEASDRGDDWGFDFDRDEEFERRDRL